MQDAEKGSMLVLAAFILLTVAILSGTFWKMIRFNAKTAVLKEGQLRAEYAARAGIEEAIYELKTGNWGQLSSMHSDWNQQTATQFSKSTLASPALAHYPYPTSFSVEVLGNVGSEPVTINSQATVTSFGETFSSAMVANVVRTLAGEFHMLKLESL